MAKREAEAERMVAEKEAEISRLEAALSRRDIRLGEAIYLSWKLGSTQYYKKKATREAEEAKEKAKRDADSK